MYLIADCGSTKIDWCLVSEDSCRRFETPGMNAALLSADEMRQRLLEHLLPSLGFDAYETKRVYFYGAGIVADRQSEAVAVALRAVLPNAVCEMESDLLAAARALCGHGAGVACIIGTGSNSCYYDGGRIVDNVSPLGYILGDEGSGAVLGRMAVANVLKRVWHPELCDDFYARYGLGVSSIIDRVYRQPEANRFLASFVPFVRDHVSHPQVEAMVVGAFSAFFERNVCGYFERFALADRRAGFVGSVAYHFADQLCEAAAMHKIEVGPVLKSPMPGLVEYHSL